LRQCISCSFDIAGTYESCNNLINHKARLFGVVGNSICEFDNTLNIINTSNIASHSLTIISNDSNIYAVLNNGTDYVVSMLDDTLTVIKTVNAPVTTQSNKVKYCSNNNLIIQNTGNGKDYRLDLSLNNWNDLGSNQNYHDLQNGNLHIFKQTSDSVLDLNTMQHIKNLKYGTQSSVGTRLSKVFSGSLYISTNLFSNNVKDDDFSLCGTITILPQEVNESMACVATYLFIKPKVADIGTFYMKEFRMPIYITSTSIAQGSTATTNNSVTVTGVAHTKTDNTEWYNRLVPSFSINKDYLLK